MFYRGHSIVGQYTSFAIPFSFIKKQIIFIQVRLNKDLCVHYKSRLFFIETYFLFIQFVNFIYHIQVQSYKIWGDITIGQYTSFARKLMQVRVLFSPHNSIIIKYNTVVLYNFIYIYSSYLLSYKMESKFYRAAARRFQQALCSNPNQ